MFVLNITYYYINGRKFMIILFLIMIIISPIFIAISLYNTVKIYRKIKYIDKYGILIAATWFAVEIIGVIFLFIRF